MLRRELRVSAVRFGLGCILGVMIRLWLTSPRPIVTVPLGFLLLVVLQQCDPEEEEEEAVFGEVDGFAVNEFIEVRKWKNKETDRIAKALTPKLQKCPSASASIRLLRPRQLFFTPDRSFDCNETITYTTHGNNKVTLLAARAHGHVFLLLPLLQVTSPSWTTCSPSWSAGEGPLQWQLMHQKLNSSQLSRECSSTRCLKSIVEYRSTEKTSFCQILHTKFPGSRLCQFSHIFRHISASFTRDDVMGLGG